jgi:hypothetical protein
MATLMRIVGTLLSGAAGILMYDLAVRDALVMKFGPLLLLLGALVVAGWLLGLLMHSWRALLAAPVAFVAGFIAAAPLRANGFATPFASGSSSGQIADLAGGSTFFAMAFLLTLLCCLLELSVALGTTRGIRIERMSAWRRARQRAAVWQAQSELARSHRTSETSRELAHA